MPATASVRLTTQALGIVELLEQILSNLPCIDIVRVQRVSTFWRSAIAHSPILQLGLFTQTEVASASTWLRNPEEPHMYKDPGTRWQHGFDEIACDPNATCSRVVAAVAGAEEEHEVIVNPFLYKLCRMPDGVDQPMYPSGLSYLHRDVVDKPLYMPIIDMDPAKHSNAWMDTLLTQPPARKVHCEVLVFNVRFSLSLIHI